MNKYGGINDLASCDKKVYNLWFQMLRRCYDEVSQKREKGEAYIVCEVCEEWKILSNFAKDIQELEGYEDWLTKPGYCLDKDTVKPGNKVYSKENCRFITRKENIGDIHKRYPQNIKRLQEAKKKKYVLKKGEEVLVFDSEKDACIYLGVAKCSVASCYRRKSKCKGYIVAKMDEGVQ